MTNRLHSNASLVHLDPKVEVEKHPPLARAVLAGYGYGWWELPLNELDEMEYTRMAGGLCVFCGNPCPASRPVVGLPLPLNFCQPEHGDFWVMFFVVREKSR